jgi:ribosomal small subunit protein bTHX
MGKGDKRSFKGKLFKGSFGKTRPRHPKPKTGEGTAGTAGATTRKK